MKMGAKLVTTLVLGVLLAVGTRMLQNRYHGAFGPPDTHVYGAGNAPEDVRREVLDVLRAFQEGYRRRDVRRLDPFMERLFSRDDVLLLGTMPLEARASYAAAVGLVRDDWTAWGDCRFAVDQARISSHGDVAWFATVGDVTFDLSKWLVLPLRLPACWRRTGARGGSGSCSSSWISTPAGSCCSISCSPCGWP